MVKRLREKFVIVTMILMLSVFGVIGITSKIYFDYWSDQDILSIFLQRKPLPEKRDSSPMQVMSLKLRLEP